MKRYDIMCLYVQDEHYFLISIHEYRVVKLLEQKCNAPVRLARSVLLKFDKIISPLSQKQVHIKVEQRTFFTNSITLHNL